MGFLSRFRKPSADDPPETESWPLFAFGKLPVYKDFISAGLTDDAAREFRDWLSNGFSKHWSARDDFRSETIPLHAFLLRLPESRKAAAGVLWGSSDQGGLRRFPFAIFTILAAGKPAASVLTALDYLPAFEARARDLRRKYDSGGSLAEVYQELRGAHIEVPVRREEQVRMKLAEALAGPSVGSLARSLFEDDAAVRWAALLTGVDAAARRPTAGAAAFRVPLADDAPLDQLKLWAVRLASTSAPAGVVYRTGGDAARGVVFFRDVRAEDILLFHPASIPTDFVEEIPPTLPRAPDAPVEAAEAPAPPPPPTTTPTPTPEAPVAAETPPATPPPAPPAETPSAAAPAPVDEFLTLGAAARPAAAPTPDATAVAAADAPSPPAVPEAAEAGGATAPLAEAPSPAPAAEAPPSAPAPEASAAETPAPVATVPAATVPAPPSPSEPVGWGLPLASLLDARS